jgi:hypothetical protein
VRSYKIKVNLGCGRKAIPGFLGVDPDLDSLADINMDAYEWLVSQKDDAVNEIYTRHFFEHLDSDQLLAIMREINRVLEDDGILTVIVPHFANPYFYSDPTHKTPFGLYSFCYMCNSALFKRGVPAYVRSMRLTLESVRVNFVPRRRMKILFFKFSLIEPLLNLLVNSSSHFQEIYEKYFVYFFSPYEIIYKIRKS